MLTEKTIKYKIDYEIVVDCYDEYEIGMSWYYFMEETIGFPFQATAKLKKNNGVIEKKKSESQDLQVMKKDSGRMILTLKWKLQGIFNRLFKIG
jgi:Calcium binding